MGVEIEAGWEDLAHQDIIGDHYTTSNERIARWVGTMRHLLEAVEPGNIYVCIDGRVFDRNSKDIGFKGLVCRTSIRGDAPGRGAPRSINQGPSAAK